jgi:hypothetical protein
MTTSKDMERARAICRQFADHGFLMPNAAAGIIAAALAAERAECVKAVEARRVICLDGHGEFSGSYYHNVAVSDCAAAIRARGGA